MTIEQFMKDNNAQLVSWGNWLCWVNDNQQWAVRTREYKARHNTVLYDGADLEKALTALKGEEK